MCQETHSSNEVSFKIMCYGVEKWAIKGKTVGTINKGREKQKRLKENLSEETTASGPRAHQANTSFTAFSCEVMSKDNIFILDSGATNHLVVGSLEEYVSEIKTLPKSVVIKTTNGGEMIATRAGKFMGDYGSETISCEALIVPGLKNDLLSVSKLTQKNLTSFQ
ncbi:hypothetical protein PR048_003715 [Dryococelus australis]|uniref:Retrovirus-related Pol polyprotein from transposon TNT 1-94-like beta-barrel domain-containing protein n=1 Tax=Dryococelus australis TaxID=614101 RepID=A0ABQ9INU0_9NEOP|nr:hypothetical protein PR048_003715 [Dryococelus australis]